MGVAEPPPRAPILQACFGPGVARQQGLCGLVSLLRDVKAQCESKKKRGNLAKRLGRGPAIGTFPKVSSSGGI